jgi:leader peptidase (prepilin peptidase)/N-methyltransferase
MDVITFYEIVFAVAIFFLGACIGSFLNVAIYRMPLGLAVNEPARSFCPLCKEPIPWYRNIPIYTWLSQRGRGACCGKPIAMRYVVVEALTACLFLAVWLLLPKILSPAYFVLVSLLVVGTFVDIDHFILPDEVTYGLTLCGLIFSFLLPGMMNVSRNVINPLEVGWNDRIAALGLSAFGALSGLLLLWGIVEFGKLLFGRIRQDFEKPLRFQWERHGDDATLRIGEEEPEQWSEIFNRRSDRLIMNLNALSIDGEPNSCREIRFTWEKLITDAKEHKLDHVDKIEGEVTRITIPREAMGFGDVKLMTGIGAFMGWQSVLFTLGAGSVIGTSFALAAIISGRREVTQKIPFGPYLAAGALIWLFFGWDLLALYRQWLDPNPDVLPY